MKFGRSRRVRVLAMSLSTAAVTTLLAVGTTTGSASAAGVLRSTCPPRVNFKSDNNVAARFSNNGNTTTYFFLSLANEGPLGGVPGLIGYCVYPTAKQDRVHAIASGANGARWLARQRFRLGPRRFSFVRPDGDPSNIPLNGMTTLMGTATGKNAPPGARVILLHIHDPRVCGRLYPHRRHRHRHHKITGTCWVKPGQVRFLPPPPPSACDIGDNTVAYNAMPFGVIDCPKPSLGFEAQSVAEFGDRVQLAPGSGRTLMALNVLFASFACESGHWNLGDCKSTTGDTFTHPITANIYAVNNSTSPPTPGPLLATETVTQTIPYRPSGDPSCPAVPSQGVPAGAQWFNPRAPNGGQCQNSISTVLSFDSWTFTGSSTLPDQVIWTVAFNTTHFGYKPIGQGAACFSGPGGCPYDSLNVGVMSYPGAPYAGFDVDEDEAFISTGEPPNKLHADFGWTGLRPLGEIFTSG